jgi:aminomethyltransferase
MGSPADDGASLLTSPLHERHVALGAKFAEFGGWSMPLEYAGSGIVKEHTAVREAVGIFDVSHLGKAVVPPSPFPLPPPPPPPPRGWSTRR